MKRTCAVLLLAFVLAAFIVPNFSHAQDTGYAVTDRGADYKVLQKTTVEHGTNRVHQYTELATGLNYTNASGQWVESQEQITVQQGGASAVQGQHKVYFPADIYDGVLEVVTPDGRHLKSRPLGVSYDDGSNTVFIAALTNSIGVLTASNQVTYPDAFTDFKADLVCTYRRGGFESDLVFRQRPPTPDAYGLNPATSTLQLVTEFFNTQDPQEIPAASDEWFGLQDSTLKFGALTMTHGKAFAVGNPDVNSAAVYKTWTHIQGRTFLIEEVPLVYLADDLQTLPDVTNVLTSKITGKLRMASNHRQMPPSHEFVSDASHIQIASVSLNSHPGVVLDYDEIDSGQTDFTFTNGTTYYVDGEVDLSSTTTFEGGAVLKFDRDGELVVDTGGTIVCNNTPDHPTIFTSINDDSVGQTIDGSGGIPSVGDANIFLSPNSGAVIRNMRFSYANNPIDGSSGADLDVWDCQFLYVSFAIGFYNNLGLHNVLFSQTDDHCIYAYSGSGNIVAENVTFDGARGIFADGILIAFTNCLITGTFGIDSNGDGEDPCTLATNSDFWPPYGYSPSTPVYQTAASANYYLTNGSPYRNAGTTNINPDLLAELQTMTTYAPQDGGFPDTNTPDLGYHYPVNEDSDYDGIPDWWIWKYFGNYAYSGVDLDGGGNTLLYDYQSGHDPLDYFNGILPKIVVVSGDNQYGITNAWLPMPLAVMVTDTNSIPLTNAPVTFAVSLGDGLISTSINGLTNRSIQALTGSNGQALIWLQLSSTNGANMVTASAFSGTNLVQTSFIEITSEITMMGVGGEHITELTSAGDVVSWGENQHGELGDYTHLDSTNPVHVVGLTNIVKIASGLNHTLALDASGTLWVWGKNESGQLGDGSNSATNFPETISGMTNIIAIAAHEYVAGSDGIFGFSSAVKNDGTVWVWGEAAGGPFFGNSPVQITGITNAIAVAVGETHALALLSDGTVQAWGENNRGQLGNGTEIDSDTPVQVTGLSNIVAICAGDIHNLALDSNGNVWAWGEGNGGQLGNGLTVESDSPVLVVGLANVVEIAAGATHSVAMDNQGRLWAWGNDGSGQLGDGGLIGQTNLPFQVSGLSNIISIAAGSDASVALDGNGNLWQWGEGLGDSQVWAWGDTNGYPQLSPTYVDFYNGHLPNLTITNGNNQTPHAGSEFAQPLVFHVTDADGAALSNAPISVEVIAGDMELRIVSGGDNYKGLRLTTDANGEVSLIGFADDSLFDTNCLVRVLAASREQLAEVDFNETLFSLPTINIASPLDGSTNLIGTNQTLTITVDAEPAPGLTIQEVDYSYGTNGIADTSLGVSTASPYTFTWTNASWWSNDFVGQYTLSAVAIDNLGGRSVTNTITTTIALDTYWLGIPDYLIDTNGTLAAWQTHYFGSLGLDPNGDYDNDGINNLQEFLNGTDPNNINFSFTVTNQYVSTNTVNGMVTILGGVPSYYAVLVDGNFTTTNWIPYTSSNITVNFDSTQGSHDIWIGLRGLPTDAQQTWEETTLVLGTNPPTITITNPVNNVSFNSSRVNVSGNFTAVALKQITVNDVLAFIHGTNFEALNVPLAGSTNIVTAIIEDLNGGTNIYSIKIIGLTNTDGSMNNPVQLQATPVAGFVPLPVTFAVQTNVPGTMPYVLYDFNGDNITDLVTNNLLPLTYTYATNGEYFPVVTIQTTAGRFSSIGGWNAVSLDPSNQPVQINVQPALIQTTFISPISHPVDLKWMPPCHLYVLSGSGPTTITEFNTNGTSIRCLSNMGASSGFDVDAAGNVYVAVTASNQVWKLFPTNSSFQVDTNFGNGGCIGLTNGLSGTGTNEFNAPFDVAVSPDGSQISVSDSGNNRIQQFDANGNFSTSFGSSGSDVGQFNTPKGLTFDSSGTLYIVDSGNNRIAMAQNSGVVGITGTNGTALGQFNSPTNISVGEQGIYVADAGNNRIQSFDPPITDGLFSIDPSAIRFAVSSGLSAPAAVAAVNSLTNEIFYVADTGNNRILLYTLPADDPTPAWTNLTMQITAGNVEGALSSFSSASVDDYRQAWTILGISGVISDMNQIGPLTPVFIKNDKAKYYFEQTVDGQLLLFPVEFVKENGVWKILEF